MEKGGTKHVNSKNDAFEKLWRPNTWGDLWFPIEMFGLYTHPHPPIWFVHPILEIYPIKLTSTRKKISKGGNGTDSETMDEKVPKGNGKYKWGHCIKNYFRKTITTTNFLYQYIILQGWHMIGYMIVYGTIFLCD